MGFATIRMQFENKVLDVVDDPWYARNTDLYRDVIISLVIDEIQQYASNQETRLHNNVTVELLQLLVHHGREKPSDLVWMC